MDRGLPARVAAMVKEGLASSEESRTIMAIYSQQQVLDARGKMVKLLIEAQAETIDSLARVRSKCDAAEEQNRQMQRQISTQETLIAEKDQSIRTLSAQLNDARTTVRKQLGEINALREDLDTNVSRIELLKQLLKEHVDRLSVNDEPRLAFLRDARLYRSNSKAYTCKSYRKPCYHSPEMAQGRVKKSICKKKELIVPKRPMSAFFFWMQENRVRLKKPGMGIADVAKAAGAGWRELSDKSEWEKKAENDKKRYERETTDYKNAKESEGAEADDDIDYDKTGDSLDDSAVESHTRSGMVFRRSSRGAHPLPHRRSVSAHAASTGKRSHSRVFEPVDEEMLGGSPKRSKNSSALTAEQTETTTATLNTERPGRLVIGVRRSMNRSMSESQLAEKEAQLSSGLHPVGKHFGLSTQDLRTPRRLENWTNGQPIEGRPHRFEKLTAYFKITSCDVCHGGINFAAKPAVKCNDCNQHVHVDCKRRLALPCVPKSATPHARSRVNLRLQDFCPSSVPMIPAALIHCVVALNKRVDYPGIYRIPGRTDQVGNLMRELRTSRAVPKMELQDTEVITDCVKRFLMELRDPLIPKTSRAELIEAAQEEDMDKLNVAICELPQPNRDTLAYLILHWKKVAGNSTRNKMPLENLVRVLAPTVVGYPNAAITSTNAADETKKQQAVLSALLNMNEEYWSRFLKFDKKGRCAAEASSEAATKFRNGTPAGRPREHENDAETARASDVNRSLLGPIWSTKAPRVQPVLRPKPVRSKFLLDPQ